ncbi:MAG: cyclase family protein [Chloroflexi bacterium]|nr:cyclase family protein [Chloroflexota bacterium]
MTAYRDLPLLQGLGLPHAWDEFGPGDQLGTINRLTPERTLAALQIPRLGRAINLSLPLNLPNPPMFGRKPYSHVVYPLSRNEQDDYIDSLHLQASSQWDGLRHVRAREFGFYGGRGEDAAGPGGSELGIQAWAERGIIGRGVLLDVAAFMEGAGVPLDPWNDTPITAGTLERTAAAEGVALAPGDILLVRTGWMSAYLALSGPQREAVAGATDWPGLSGDAAMAEFLWDHEVAAVAADNPAVEDAPGDPSAGSLHRRLIPLLGMALGELWALDELAAFAREHRRYECCVVSVPLNIPGGVGSPANALALV